jgi:hypothetical protein
MFRVMWKALVNLAKRCLRTVLRKPVARQETRVRTPAAEYDEEAALAYAHKLITEFLDIYHQWKAGTLPPHMLRKPPVPRSRKKPQRISARPQSIRRAPAQAAPVRQADPARPAPARPKSLRPRARDRPE